MSGPAISGESKAKRSIRIRLIHDGAQPGPPLEEVLHFGLQDDKSMVHPGLAVGALRHFDLTLEVKVLRDSGLPVFSGAFAHGPPSARFLYLSWKRAPERAAQLGASWGWRIKIPLGGIAWAEIDAADRPGMGLVANVVGRRPHVTAPIVWRVAALTAP